MPLTKQMREILLEVHNQGTANVLPSLPPMRFNPKCKNSGKFCGFHDDYDHNTDECIQFKNALEDAIRHRYLKDYVVDLRIRVERLT